LKANDTASISGAYGFFVEEGEPGSEQALIDTLNQSGKEWQAELLLTCGNARLEEAARAWLIRHGMPIHQDVFGPTWGSVQTTPSPLKRN